MVDRNTLKAVHSVLSGGKPKLINGVLFALSGHQKKSQALQESRDHERLIKRYTFNSKDLNKSLFNHFMSGETPPEELHGFNLHGMDEAIHSYSSPNEGTLHMGVGFDPSDYLKNGSGHIHFPAFSSTSQSPRVAGNFSKGHVLDIDMNGHRSAPIDHLSYYGAGVYNDPEYEHVLPRHTTVKLTGEHRYDPETRLTHWNAQVVGQGSPEGQEHLREHPVNLGSYENSSPEQLHKAIIQNPSEDNAKLIASHPNLSPESIKLLSEHPSAEVKSTLSASRDLPEKVRAKMVQDDVPKVDEHLNAWKHPKLSDATSKILIEKGKFPKNGLSGRVFNSHVDRINPDFYKYGKLTDAQYEHAAKYHSDKLEQNPRLSGPQVLKNMNAGLKVDSSNAYSMFRDRNFYPLPEEKRLRLDPSNPKMMEDIADLSPSDYKKAKKTFSFESSGLGNDALMTLFTKAHPEMLNDMAKAGEFRAEQQALLVNHPKLSEEGLVGLATEEGKNRFRFHKPEATTAISALHHRNMTKEGAQKIVDYWKDKKSNYFDQIERTAKRIK